MLRKLLESFTATHITILALGAMFIPGALVAAVTTSAVSITDPNTGAKSYIDPARRLSVNDPTAGYRNNPANYVDIYVSNAGTRCETNYSYTIPAGKALIITAISGFESGSGTAAFYVYANASCTGNQLTSHASSLPNGKAPVEVDLGSGIPVPAGSVVTVFSSVNSGYTNLHGYLVPAGAVPASVNVAGAEKGALDVNAKMKQR